ncbi:MAG TPA: hypothetical protein VK911_11710 [Vicinamibacterales bacterium]|nr:hypothetical protein [Vicinamibacterales bacterium]
MNRSLVAATLGSLLFAAVPLAAQTTAPAAASLFRTADGCISCHNQLVGPGGENISIGTDWQPSMMANSARDPYWQGAVRREVLDHPEAQAAIEHECSACHMPMTRYAAKAAHARGAVFAHLPIGGQTTPEGLLAADGVSCTMCHQILPEKLGTRDSFTAGFVIDTAVPYGHRPAFGPYEVTPGLTSLMRSSAEFTPTTAAHLATSEMCATCHTLYTHALGAGGKVIGELPEQVPYLEWRHSAYRAKQTCQACHMPVVDRPVRISSTLGEPRPGFSRHEFRGANFYMPRILNRYAADLTPAALPQDLEAAGQRSADFVKAEAARLSLAGTSIANGQLTTEVQVENLGGHKLPTAYPSRRAWLHVAVRDAAGRIVFESGGFEPTGAIRGNDNDADAARYEPHHAEIASEDQVQIYESIMGDEKGAVTTGLLQGVRYLKDNRVLPQGFDKATAEPDIAVRGEAGRDEDFVGGRDAVRYRVDLRSAEGPFTVEAALWYQPIGFRWAQNLKRYEAPEPQRFARMYDETAAASAIVLARTATTVKE